PQGSDESLGDGPGAPRDTAATPRAADSQTWDAASGAPGVGSSISATAGAAASRLSADGATPRGTPAGPGSFGVPRHPAAPASLVGCPAGQRVRFHGLP